MSRQADEVITMDVTVEPAGRKASNRPHLIHRDRMVSGGSAIELLADAVSFRESVPPRSQLQMPEAAAVSASRHVIYHAVKRLLDIVGSLVIGLAFSPLIVVIAVRMGLEDGPILFRHRRIGQGGRMFECLKFRTMVPNAEQILRDLLETDPQANAEWSRDHKLKNDPRVTPIGRFLRRTSLDELPQLLNVIRGEMSLVGPRPIVKEEMLRYGKYARRYLAAKPGVTGLWQVTGRNDTDYRRRVALDAYYVKKHSILMDLTILLKTIKVVVWGRGAY